MCVWWVGVGVGFAVVLSGFVMFRFVLFQFSVQTWCVVVWFGLVCLCWCLCCCVGAGRRVSFGVCCWYLFVTYCYGCVVSCVGLVLIWCVVLRVVL